MRALLAALGSLAAVGSLALCGCVGKGSEVGPQLPDPPEQTAAGVVLDPQGNPISNAAVTMGSDTRFTDARGRFRFPTNPQGNVVLTVDARMTTNLAVPAGIFDQMTVSGTFAPDTNGVFSGPIILPNFTLGASAAISVNQGAALAGTLVDPASGAELVLTGAVATIPGSTATSTTLRFVSFPADSASVPLDVQGVIRAGALYFAIAPAGIQFATPPTVRTSDATFGIAAAISHGKLVSPELDALDSSGAWGLEGAAAVGGGSLSSAAVSRGGIHCLSIASPGSSQTIVTATIVDRNLDPLPRALSFARDGRASRADNQGLLAIPGVQAADADGVPIPVTLTSVAPIFRAQQAIRTDVLLGKPGVGLTTDFNDRPLATVPAGRVRVLCLYRGEAMSNARVGVANSLGGTYSAEALSNPNGVDFPDTPHGAYVVTTAQMLNATYSIRDGTSGSVGEPGVNQKKTLFMSQFKLKSPKQEGILKIQTFRAGSGAILHGAYGLLGIDPSVSQQNVTDGTTIQLSPVTQGLALTTAARQFEVPGVGTSVDAFLRVGFVTQLSDTSLRRPALTCDLDLMPKGFDPAGDARGAASGLTDPGAVPPVNGNYSVEVRARRKATFEDRIAVALGGQKEPLVFLPDTARAPTFADPNYETLVPAGTAAVALVERDTTNPGSKLGPIRNVGFAAEVAAGFGQIVTQDIALGPSAATAFATSVSGAVPALFQVGLVLQLADDSGLDLGDQGSFTYVSGTGALQVDVPAGLGTGVAAIATATGTTANQSNYFTAAASVLAEGTPALFLTIPELAAPPPAPGDFIVLSPTGAGISWADDPLANETVLRVTRSAIKIGSDGKKTDAIYTWTLTLPTPVSFPFKFPETPPNINEKPVPSFFEAGAVYDLVIETRRYLDYDQRTAATSSDIVPPSFFQLRSVATTQVQFKVQ